MEEIKSNLKEELLASRMMSRLAVSNDDKNETMDQRMTTLVKVHLDKTNVSDKGLPELGAPKATKKIPEPDDVHSKIKRACMELVEYRMSSDIFNEDELSELEDALLKHATPPPSHEKHMDTQKYIIYKDYMNLRNDVPPQFKHLLSATLFMRLISNDPYGRVPIFSISQYISKKSWLKRGRLDLMRYDRSGKGYITHESLESYLHSLFPTLTQLVHMNPKFEQFYLCSASRRFFFLLDPLRKSSIKITDILASGLIDEFREVCSSSSGLSEYNCKQFHWFSYDGSKQVYNQFLQLDMNHTGMLNKQEFTKYVSYENIGNVIYQLTLTQPFVDRLFSECVTYDGEMDYQTFVDFVLAIENMETEQAIPYFFRMLDTTHKGYLDTFDLCYFLKGVELEQHGTAGPANFTSDLQEEIIDMINPKDRLKITQKDLVQSGTKISKYVIRILIDPYGLFYYEGTRETSTHVEYEVC